MADPWAEFADAPSHLQPGAAPNAQALDDWSEFADAPKKYQPRKGKPSAGISQPTGEVHDGDTFTMRNGGNARLYGADAFELGQTGLQRGQVVPIGTQARDYLQANISPSSTVGDTGTRSYGRPVVSLETQGRDVPLGIIETGNGMAAPDYIRSDPALLRTYMEAERLARLNRRGAHAGRFQNPEDFRAGKPDPWAQPEAGEYGDSIAVFPDDPTPFQGLRPEIAEGYQRIWTDPKSKPDDLIAYANANGFIIDPETTRRAYAERAKRGADPTIRYASPPAVLTDPGDGALGSGVRGLSDPINMLDELGGVVDTLGLTPGRENIWSSDRRFADILYNNIDQNRGILGYDDANHPYARFAGQLGSGLVIPGASVEGIGLAAARQVLRAGGSRIAAEEAAKAAVRRQLAIAGAAEGGLAGFGQGEGGVVDRLPGAALGAGAGAALGYGTGALAQEIGPVAREALERIRGRSIGEAAADQAPGVGVDEVLSEFPQPGRVASMANEGLEPTPSIISPRTVDRIDVNNRARPLLDPASDMERMAQAERVNPADVLPLPSNVVASQEEAARIGEGLYPTVRAPNEAGALESRALPRGDDPAREIAKRGPADLVTFLRSRGGLIDQGGELRAMGIRDNAGRDLDFARGEQRFGKLVDNENGLTLDQAADLAWRAGYFPDHTERPTISEFLDVLDGTNRGVNRAFRPDDLAEVDAFNAARDQRLAVERAREQGAPLVEDRGQPVTMDDLEANQPPVSAYEEWGEQAPDFAGNIRLANLDSPQSIQRALAQTERMTGGFDAARRGRIAQAETEQLASELGMTPQQLLSRRKGQAFNAEEALAARQILAKSANELVNMARRIQRQERPGDEELAMFREAVVRHAAIQEQVSGATAEAGRALQQFRMLADASRVRGNVLAALVQRGGGAERLKDAAEKIIDSVDHPELLNRAVEKGVKPKWRDKFVELWYNSLLSGPQTHAVNVASNTMTALLQIPEHAVAATIGGARSLALRGRVADRVLFSELGARTFGLLQGAKEGLAQAGRTFRTGESSDLVSKVEGVADNAIGGRVGKVVNTPTRALAAEDELFKAMARRMEIGGLAIRKARNEGLTGAEAKQRAAELVANPTDDMLDRAFDYGRYLTFQRPLGPVGSKITGVTNDVPLLKLFLPFIRTPTNIMKYALERSPAAPLLKEVRKEFVAGGARRDLALARIAAGTGVGMAVADLAARGLITGNGPADEGAKEVMRADGWQPYSIRIGDQYVSYQRFDPLALTFGVAADLVELQDHMTDKQRDKVGALLIASTLQNLGNKTWLSGLSDVVGALEDPERNSSRVVNRTAASLTVPAVVAQTTRTMDPTLREAKTILDSIRARIPGLSDDLLPKRDIWGEPIVREGGIGPDIVSPAWESTRRNDPVNRELLEIGAHIGQPQQKDLSDEDYDGLLQLRGRLAKAWLNEAIRDPAWQGMTKGDKLKYVEKVKDRATETAKEQMFGPKPERGRSTMGPAVNDPWGEFQDAPGSAPTGDPWAEFRDAG